jgi:hypothetical protein
LGINGGLRVKVGDRIKLKYIKNDTSYNGHEGVVLYIDDYGILYGTWGDVGVFLETDSIEKVEENFDIY